MSNPNVRTLPTPLTINDFDVGVTLGKYYIHHDGIAAVQVLLQLFVMCNYIAEFITNLFFVVILRYWFLWPCKIRYP